jgi:hypothetical protein
MMVMCNDKSFQDEIHEWQLIFLMVGSCVTTINMTNVLDHVVIDSNGLID